MSVNPLYLGCANKTKPSLLPMYEQGGWVLQEKFDGWWCLYDFDGQEVECSSRRGHYLSRPTEVMNGKQKPNRPMEIVGEWLPDNEVIVAFDIIALDGRDLRHTPLLERLDLLDQVCPTHGFFPIQTFSGDFKAHYDLIVRSGGEGVVLKYMDSLYMTAQKDRKAKTWIKCKPEYENEDNDTKSPVLAAA